MPRSTDTIAQRSQQLAAAYEHIARTRMAGLPVVHAALRVEALGFALLDDEDPVALGILVTPWFMNLVCLPLAWADGSASVGQVQMRQAGRQGLWAQQPMAFIQAHEPSIGAHSACSLFSPMSDFADQAGARAVALAVLAELRGSAPAVGPAAPLPARAAAQPPARPPARRAFLFGRPHGAGLPP